ncbi:hypothetical protein K437DRAFT_261375 [Tilletiaria anomala UBC 951]|uniref:Uncharacterized protein n=1 Tax=Tilletiaria anomala (strain ATCC 24038 / CBS 436.72 / UBC 951) TaxID=1037660 RepID=A0A066WFA2_TILAU|nr:uncharacterized protein K437DRAFT_261375 [Tilletiaria anomala UBC 951]KDN52446.1 hypothetical protein K437DRAFT_261375 [Tilletiaria anomala UBC 951]
MAAPAPSPSGSSSSSSSSAHSLSPAHLPSTLNASTLIRAIRKALETFFGDAGAGTCGGALACRYYSPKTGMAIIRCAREAARTVWAAITMINELEGRRVRIAVVHCSGTIKKTQMRAIEMDKKVIFFLRRHNASSERRADVERQRALFAMFQTQPGNINTAEALSNTAALPAGSAGAKEPVPNVEAKGGVAAQNRKRKREGQNRAADGGRETSQPLDEETKKELDASMKAIMAIQQ